MVKNLPRFDWSIIVCVLLLCGFGTAVLASIAPELLSQQVFYYLFGLGLFYLFSRIDFQIYPSLAKLAYIFSLILLAITLVIGLETRGAVRWIPLGPFRLQFSEILKPVLIFTLASMLFEKKIKNLRGFFKLLATAALPIFLVMRQPDLGSAIVYLFGFGSMIFVSGISLSYIFLAVISGLFFLPLSWHFLADYQKQRIVSFISPGYDPLGATYNAIQAVITVGSGMFLGRGLGHGTQSHLLFLPERHTDFVFASLSEEFGFVGAAFLLTLYFVLIWRIFRIGLNSRSKLGRLLCVGLGTILLSQVAINIGMNLGLLPVTGITLPLVSYGGSSVLATMVSLGIIENVVMSDQSHTQTLDRASEVG